MQLEMRTRTGMESVNGWAWGSDFISYEILGCMQDYLNFTCVDMAKDPCNTTACTMNFALFLG